MNSLVTRLSEGDNRQWPSETWGQDVSTVTTTDGETGLVPQFILFGDSITQDAALTFQARLQDIYTRRADVINRGYSGYTTSLALCTLPRFLPLSTPSPGAAQAPIRLVTIFFGANDLALPGFPQHVPLEQYVFNLQRLIDYPVFQSHGTKIILITPGPLDEWQLSKPLNRTAKRAQQYAQAVKQLAKDLGIACVDTWTAFMRVAGYIEDSRIGNQKLPHNQTQNGGMEEVMDTSTHAAKPHPALRDALPGSLDAPSNKVLPTLLEDGLHFTPQGYDLLFDELMRVILTDLPSLAPENMPKVFQDWKVILGVLPPPTPAETREEAVTMAATAAAGSPKIFAATQAHSQSEHVCAVEPSSADSTPIVPEDPSSETTALAASTITAAKDIGSQETTEIPPTATSAQPEISADNAALIESESHPESKDSRAKDT